MPDVFREGWTERIKYQLSADGAVLNLTGLSVALVGKDNLGIDAGFAGAVGIDTPAAGTVFFDPAPSDLVASRSPFRLRWQVTDGAGKIAYFPRADGAMIWQVDLP